MGLFRARWCGLILTLVLFMAMPEFNHGPAQHKKLILKKRYSLYYLLTFFSGARRQIFVVFELLDTKFNHKTA